MNVPLGTSEGIACLNNPSSGVLCRSKVTLNDQGRTGTATFVPNVTELGEGRALQVFLERWAG